MKKIYTLPLLILLAAQSMLAAPVKTDQVTAELIAEQRAIQPGESFYVGVKLDLIAHWHLYWTNPGDSGLPPEITWNLPEGFSAGDIEWPYPEYLNVGGLATFGYENSVLLMVPLKAPDNLTAGTDVTLKANVDWLVCDKVCLPGGAALALTLPVSESAPAPSDRADLFSMTRKQHPQTLPSSGIEAMKKGDNVVLTIPSALLEGAPKLHFFPNNAEPFANTAEQTMRRSGDRITLDLPLNTASAEHPDRLTGVLVSESGWTAHPDRHALTLDLPFTTGAAKDAVAAEDADPIAMILVWAFLGGLILNLMPCVFPVLGLKIMGFVEQAGASRARVTGHGIWFTAGVLVSFWVLAGALIAIRAGGQELGWGFQLQSPLFVYGLALFLFAFALNLSGVFEIGTTLTQLGDTAEKHSGYRGTFMSGVLATLVATPCAAPILAGALGTALTLPAAQSMLVFTFIALGLSTPYLLLSMFPALVQRLPRPGPWMETFKQAMAFLLYATVAYLLWVVLGQVEPDKSLNLLFGLVLVSVAAWVYGRFASLSASTRSRWIARISAVILIIASIQLALAAVKKSDIHWETWSPEKVETLRAEGRTVYVDFTARWCVTCKANKLAVFTSDKVIRAFNDQKIAALKADWTNQDPEITRALAAFGRSAVPFNLIYKPGAADPVILPEILTAGIVLDALQSEN